jgi:hypothetical protein
MIQFTSIVQNSNKSWTFTWADAGVASYRVVLDGILLAVPVELSYTTELFGYEDYPPELEVVKVGELALSEQYSPYVYLQWYYEPCVCFVVKQLVGASWVQVARIMNNEALWVYTWRTRKLTDDTDYQFRIYAVDMLGNESVPRQWKFHSECPPKFDQNSIAVTYSGGNVIVSNA